MRAILIFTVMIFACLSKDIVSDDYYTSFIETIGLNDQMDEELECSKAVYSSIANLKAALDKKYKDTNVLLNAAVSFADKIKFKVSPACRRATSEFENFLTSYNGDAKLLRVLAEENFDDQRDLVGITLSEAYKALTINEDDEAGKLHAKVIRILFALDEEDSDEPEQIVESDSEKDSDEAGDIFGGGYKDYINQLSIINAVEESSDSVSDVSDNGSEKPQEPVYASRLISDVQQDKKRTVIIRKLQENPKHFEARSHRIDL